MFNFSTLEKEFKYLKSKTEKCSTILSVIKEKETEEMYKDNFVVLHFQQSTCICNPLSSRSKFGKHRDIKIIILSYRDEFEIIQHEPYIQQERACN